MLPLLRLSLKSKIVRLTLENTRFGFEDIADIEKTLIAIFDNRGYLVRCSSFSHYSSAVFFFIFFTINVCVSEVEIQFVNRIRGILRILLII